MKKVNKLTSIRGNMILFSGSIILLMTILSVYSLSIMNQYQNQIGSMFENHIYLNKIETEMISLDENLLGFLTSKSSSKLNDYLISVEKIDGYFEEFYNTGIVHNKLMMKNANNLIQQYKVESDLAITFKRQRNVKEYDKHYEKSKKIQGFVFEYIDEMNQQQMSTNSIAYIELSEQTKLLKIITLVIIADLIIFSVLIVYMLTSKMTIPILHLYKSAEEISKGNFETEDVIITSDDEFRLLGNAFNNMKNSIVSYIDALKLKAETEAKLKDEQMKNLKMAYLLDNAKLSALQSQINPHFLFNTINAGVQLSVIEKATKTGHFLETMSRLFRYSLRMQHDNCTLKDELDNIRDYYELLKVRFRDRIKFEFIISGEGLDVSMPAMILQPIVENSYIHGLSSLESGGTITIRSYVKDEFVVVSVKDNGVGMLENDIADILEELDESEGSIGIKNVRNRLELYYHGTDLFEMKSDSGVETIVKLPL